MGNREAAASQSLMWKRHALASKEMVGLERPRLDMTAVLCHGHAVALFLAEPGIVKGASWTVDVLAHCLHVLQVECGLDLREYSLKLQGDNCSKELKSNSVAKFLSLLVARKRLRRADLQTLVSGHSHEDIDQFFSVMSAFLASQGELHDAVAFEDAMKTFVSNPSVRPCEPLRIVKRVSQVRDWSRGCNHVEGRVLLVEGSVFWSETDSRRAPLLERNNTTISKEGLVAKESLATPWNPGLLLEGHGRPRCPPSLGL